MAFANAENNLNKLNFIGTLNMALQVFVAEKTYSTTGGLWLIIEVICIALTSVLLYFSIRASKKHFSIDKLSTVTSIVLPLIPILFGIFIFGTYIYAWILVL